jgi:outer membrane protein OmpA-like peptidoglycan-associated protein
MPSFPADSRHAASSTMLRLLPIVFLAGLAACTGTVSRYGSGVSSDNARSAQGAPGDDVPAAAPVKKAAAPAARVQTEAIPAGANTVAATGVERSADSSQNGQSSSASATKLDESGAAAEPAASDSGAESADHTNAAAGESAQPDTQAVAAATDASGANLKPEAGATADAASGQNTAAASAGNDNAGGSMAASGESSTAGASEPAKVAAISSDSLSDGGGKLSGATGEGADGLKAGAVTGAEAATQADQPAPKQDTVGLVDVPGKKATVKEDRIPQTLGGMLPMTLGVDGDGEFDFDKAVVRPEVKGLLDKLAAKLKDSEYDTLDIVGHADRLGTEEYNQSLSERRAWAVARYLIAQGVPLQKIRVEGHGVSEPLTKPEECAGLSKTDAIACLQKDRRVEIAASIRNTEVKVQ